MSVKSKNTFIVMNVIRQRPTRDWPVIAIGGISADVQLRIDCPEAAMNCAADTSLPKQRPYALPDIIRKLA
ncbi:MAG TPA: hypothetical protein VKA94_05425 [Hyphomicrobiales bacterium]|nr:hypothetical protein [Hyphomicrobiales bacterium]